MSATPNNLGKKNSIGNVIWQDFGMIVILAILILACGIWVPGFASIFNMKSLSLAVSMTGMVACTMMLVLASGNFDMSCGAVIACTGVICAQVINPPASASSASSSASPRRFSSACWWVW